MVPMLAQLAKSTVRHFEVADGFAITLIAILFMVLGGFAAVAWWFYKRQQNPSIRDRVLNDLDQAHDPNQTKGAPTKPSKSAGWERDDDWWKKS